MSKLKRTYYLSGLVCCVFGISAFLIQSRSFKYLEDKVSCSYLDPLAIDVFAIIISIVLMVEGAVDIFNHKNSRFRNQLGRCARICFGLSVFVIHVMQFIYK